MAVDKSFNSKSNDDSSGGTVSSKTAMMDYYDDVLGSLEDDPLKKLEEAEQRKKTLGNVQVLSASGSNNSNEDRAVESLSRLKVKPKLKVKATIPKFAEPEVKKISPLIIPAAFPKMAPEAPESKQKVVEQLAEPKTGAEQSGKTASKNKEKSELTTKTNVSIEPKAKLDRKTALEIIERKRSRLTPKQLERLEQKLGLSSKVVSKSKPRLETTSKEDDVIVDKTLAKPHRIDKGELAKSSLKANGLSKVHLKQSALVNEKNDTPLAAKTGKPAWAQDRFECLIFTVAGLKLAVPLISLGAVYKIEKELTPIPGRAEHFMGLYRHLDRNVRVVDTAQWVMPDRWSFEVREKYKFIIRLGGSDWGLACDSVAESIQLTSEQVKWRSERTKRSWLFGTVIGHMCALLDADMLGSMLEDKAS